MPSSGTGVGVASISSGVCMPWLPQVHLEHLSERLDRGRIELCPRTATEFPERPRGVAPLAIRAVRRYGTVGIHDRHDACAQRNRVACQAVGVAPAIPALVV